jgi:hypothetical protein
MKPDDSYLRFFKQSWVYEELKKFTKADAPLLSSTTAAWNVIYGQAVWTWANRQANLYGALPKVPWTSSGVRVATADPATWTTGITEEQTLPESIRPTYAYMKFPLKQLLTVLQYSRKQLILSQKGDDSIPTPEQLQRDGAQGHIKGLNKMLNSNAETEAGAATANNDGIESLESIDRVISCGAEEADLGGTHDGWYDPWDGSSYNRDGAVVHDAVVVHGDGTLCYGSLPSVAFGTDATFGLDALDTLYLNCRKNGLEPENAFFYTGWDTYMRWKQLIDPKERFFDPVRVNFDVNGVRTERGVEAGMLVSSYYNIPIIVDADCPTDAGISKVFLLDKSSLFLRIATPPTLFDTNWPPMLYRSAAWVKALEYESFWLTEGELCCTRFNTNGKLCALK